MRGRCYRVHPKVDEANEVRVEAEGVGEKHPSSVITITGQYSRTFSSQCKPCLNCLHDSKSSSSSHHCSRMKSVKDVKTLIGLPAPDKLSYDKYPFLHRLPANMKIFYKVIDTVEAPKNVRFKVDWIDRMTLRILKDREHQKLAQIAKLIRKRMECMQRRLDMKQVKDEMASQVMDPSSVVTKRLSSSRCST